jgi:hypothetical protein
VLTWIRLPFSTLRDTHVYTYMTDNNTQYTYNRLTSRTIGSTLDYVIPMNTRFFYAYGSISWDHRQYSVQLDGGDQVEYVPPTGWSSVDQLL